MPPPLARGEICLRICMRTKTASSSTDKEFCFLKKLKFENKNKNEEIRRSADFNNNFSFFIFHSSLKAKKTLREISKGFGADNEIRTHDLVITNDVLCQLSYISAFGIISKKIQVVK